MQLKKKLMYIYFHVHIFIFITMSTSQPMIVTISCNKNLHTNILLWRLKAWFYKLQSSLHFFSLCSCFLTLLHVALALESLYLPCLELAWSPVSAHVLIPSKLSWHSLPSWAAIKSRNAWMHKYNCRNAQHDMSKCNKQTLVSKVFTFVHHCTYNYS